LLDNGKETPVTVDTDRPVNGSDRGKRAFVLMAVMETKPKITREELISVLDWSPDDLDRALKDLDLLIRESA